MSGKSNLEREFGCATPLATVSWSSPGSAVLGPALSGHQAESEEEEKAAIGNRPTYPVPPPAKEVAEDPVVTHSLWVPEAHAGMMVTPSVKLLRPIGEGGMGAVWVAEHLSLRTHVVVKFIASGLKDSKEATERFSREAAAAAQVKSPHVVQTFDHGFTSDGHPYIVMELLEGRDLGAYLDAELSCPPDLVLEIVAQLSRALDRAHQIGIVHRDIKPGNIFLCDSGTTGTNEVFVKLLDFGIAKGVDVPKIDSGTKTGAMIGSPFYMSPEQILGSKNVDHRSDLWSVGVVAYEALTGKKPFDAETMGGLAIRIHSEPLPLPTASNPQLSPAVDAWFAKACARAVPDRFNSARELAESLAAALGGEMPRSMEMPRSSTGSNPDVPTSGRGTPALATGSTTEAGVVRTNATSTTRNRVLALAAFAAVLFIGTFIVVSTLKRNDGAKTPTKNATSEPSTPAATTTTPIATSVTKIIETAPTQTAAPPPPTDSATAIKPANTKVGASGGHPAGHLPTTTTKPNGTSPSSRPTLPSATTATTPPTAPTGHDIF
jgi:eukaryotic-like serine/threonine-protein kinase